MDCMTHFFNNVFDKNPALFAEAIVNGYDWADKDAPFSLDADVSHVYVDDDGNFVCVHSRDMEDYRASIRQ